MSGFIAGQFVALLITLWLTRDREFNRMLKRRDPMEPSYDQDGYIRMGYIDEEKLQADKAAEEISKKYHKGGYVEYNEGGLLPPGISPLFRGCVVMSLASYQALTPGARKELFPNTDVEVVLTAAEVRKLGPQALEQLKRELG